MSELRSCLASSAALTEPPAGNSFGMWSLMKSPLLLGTDMTFTANPHLEKTILGIVSNTHVLGIDQDVRPLLDFGSL